MTHTSEGPDADGVRTRRVSGDEQAWPGGVLSEVNGHLLTVTLARPKIKNAQTFATWASLAEIAATVPASVRVVVIRATGSDFSAGLDLRLVQGQDVDGAGSLADVLSGSDAEAQAAIGTFQLAFSRWRDLDAIVVAAVQGRAIGAGFQLALAADLRIAAADASFVMAEPRLGLVPDLGGTHRLVELIGFSRALDVCATTRPIGAREALDWGLVNRVAAATDVDRQGVDQQGVDQQGVDQQAQDQLEVAVQELIEQICSLPADAVCSVKGLLSGASGRSAAEQRGAEREAQVTMLRVLNRP